MSLNIARGDMYFFVSHTWNVIRGKCPHQCKYCSIIAMHKRRNIPQMPLRFARHELKTNLGKDNYIFVGSSTDMWANDVPCGWIKDVLKYCCQFDNRYLFQTKNPERFMGFRNYFPSKTVLCTTIETNRDTSKIAKCPSPQERAKWISMLRPQFETMITCEPLLDFDVEPFLELLKSAKPSYVAIGADSKQSKLPEPSREKVKALIKGLQGCTDIKIKENLSRITGEYQTNGVR